MLSRCNFLYYIFTAHNPSLGQGSIFTGECQSFCSQGRGKGLCMMSLPVWLPGPMFLLEGLCLWSHVPSGGSLSLVPCSFWGVSVLRPPDRDPTYGEERAVRILLECFLVTNVCLCFAVS